MTKPEWISVDDRLPEAEKVVLVLCEIRPCNERPPYRTYICDGVYVPEKTVNSEDSNCSWEWEGTEYDEETDANYVLSGWYERICNWDDYALIVIGDFVTHWMEMPEKPNKSTDDI